MQNNVEGFLAPEALLLLCLRDSECSKDREGAAKGEGVMVDWW